MKVGILFSLRNECSVGWHGNVDARGALRSVKRLCVEVLEGFQNAIICLRDGVLVQTHKWHIIFRHHSQQLGVGRERRPRGVVALCPKVSVT